MDQQVKKLNSITELENEFLKEQTNTPDTTLSINIVSSVNGSLALEGSSNKLSTNSDRHLLKLLRSNHDVILVGAETVRVEKYQSPTRDKNGKPKIAIVSKSLDIPIKLKVFDPDSKPIIYTDSSASTNSKLSDRAEIVVAPKLDMKFVVNNLREKGHKRIICEGGNQLISQLISSGLVNEMYITISPMWVTNSKKSLFSQGEELVSKMRLKRVWSYEDYLFCHYKRLD